MKNILGLGVVAIILGVGGAVAEQRVQRTYCNPVDLNYQYNFEGRAQGISYRSGADPVILHHLGEYFLFGTITRGYWRSKDLGHWRHIKEPRGWPKEDVVAPAAWSDGKKLYLFPSTYAKRPIYTIDTEGDGGLDILTDELPFLPGAPGPWDPALFSDPETGRWFMYFGSSNLYPLYGIELDPDNKLTYKGVAEPMVALHPEQYGWERFGQDHRFSVKPFIEGAWMTKYKGKYYFQYAAPGTEYNVYANGTYVGESPMGPFKYAPNNPISYKPGGFLTGVGHGNTFEDAHGNFWNTGTTWVAVNYDFERRIVMFPAGFDADGLLHTRTRFGDFPHWLPEKRWSEREELFTGWMLLSYRKPALASSYSEIYPASNVTDENPRTYWVAGANKPGEWVTVDLGKVMTVRAIQVNFTDHRSNLFDDTEQVYTQFRLQGSADGENWRLLKDLSGEKRDRPNAYIEMEEATKTRYIRYEHRHVGSPNLAISDLRVFGHGGGEAPTTPGKFRVHRDGGDERNAFVSWERVPGAVGYNILWGLGPEKLYQCYQVFADRQPKLEIRALTVKQGYAFAIEAFNENGVSKRSEVVVIE